MEERRHGEAVCQDQSSRAAQEAVDRAQEIVQALMSGTDARLEKVRDNKRVTFGETADIYLAECELAEKSLKEDRTRLDMVRKEWEEVPIGTISTGHIESWLARNRKARKWSKSTRNRKSRKWSNLDLRNCPQ